MNHVCSPIALENKKFDPSAELLNFCKGDCCHFTHYSDKERISAWGTI